MDYKERIERINKLLALGVNFDIVGRDIHFGTRDARLYFIDGMIKDELAEKLLEYFGSIDDSEIPGGAVDVITALIPYVEADVLYTEHEITKKILSGTPCLIIDGIEEGIAIDCRTYPARGVDEPKKDKAMRGSRDGFVETIIFNTALIRRRIRSEKLRMEILEVGRSSKTDVVICYMQDRVDAKLLEKIKSKINNIKVDALSMNQESLAECLMPGSGLNPFPIFKYAERPDTAAASILEGSIAILVDNSPSAILIPCSMFDIMQEANDYYFPPITASYLRITRILVNLVTWLMTPTFLLLMQNPSVIPESLQFITVSEEINVPLFWQFIIIELALDGLRMASLNTPTMLSTPLSVVAGLVIGDFTVSSGWFNSEVMLYMAFVAIANYSQINYEMGYAFKFQRIILLTLTALFNLPGYCIGIVISFLVMLTNKTVSGRRYLYPLIPLNIKMLCRYIFRVSLPYSEKCTKR